MTDAAIEELIACQDALMQAIDRRNVDAIQEATRRLDAAIERQRALPNAPHSKDRLEHAMKQSNALSIRINTLADWTRQRIDRLAQLRGEQPTQTYSMRQKSPRF